MNIGKTSARQNAALVFPVLGCFVLYIICAFGQRRTPCINTRIQHERALNAIAKRVSRGPKPLRGCRAALCWGQGAKPLGFPQSTREHSMKKRSTQSRERVKGGTPLWGQGAKPLAESRGRASGVPHQNIKSMLRSFSRSQLSDRPDFCDTSRIVKPDRYASDSTSGSLRLSQSMSGMTGAGGGV